MLKLRELREDKNWQQKDVAEKVNRTTACVSSWETGKTEPSIDDILRLADIFEVSCDYLLGRSDEYEPIDAIKSLSSLQSKMIMLYQGLSREDQYRVLGYVQALSEATAL